MLLFITEPSRLTFPPILGPEHWGREQRRAAVRSGRVFRCLRCHLRTMGLTHGFPVQGRCLTLTGDHMTHRVRKVLSSLSVLGVCPLGFPKGPVSDATLLLSETFTLTEWAFLRGHLRAVTCPYTPSCPSTWPGPTTGGHSEYTCLMVTK